jgi:hypothetical protein
MNGLCAQTAQSLFLAAPDSLLPLLTSTNRADFMDFLDSRMKAVVKNVFNEEVEMTDRTDNYIRVATSAQSTWTMKVLPADSVRIICVVTTACAPLCDSHIRFYTTDWEPLPTDRYFQIPPTGDRLTFVELALSKDDDEILCTQYIPEANPEKQTISYRWRDSRFVGE